MANSRVIGDYREYIGKRFNDITVLDVKPRERLKNGRLAHPRAIIKCHACGKTKEMDLLNVIRISGAVKTCGCIRNKPTYKVPVEAGTRPACKRRGETANIRCKYPAPMCIRQDITKICCHQCTKEQECEMKCLNTFPLCGSQKG